MTKLCINCKWHEQHNFSGIHHCKSPNNGIDPVTGKIQSQFASSMRVDFKGMKSCGTNGNWFEPKLLVPSTSEKVITSNKPVLWQKLKGFFK